MRYIARLKYASESSFNSAMLSRGILIEVEGEVIPNPEKVNAIVRIGTIYDQSGTPEEPIFTPLDGYHTDLDLKVSEDFGDKLTAPATPRHGVKWAEGATILKP